MAPAHAAPYEQAAQPQGSCKEDSMKYGVVVTTLFAGLLAAGASAASPPTPSLLALPIVEVGEAPAPPATSTLEVGWVYRPRPTRWEATSFRPRRSPYPEPVYGPPPAPGPTTFSQIHVGFMDLNGVEQPGFLFGFRGGLALDPNVQIGGELDWRHQGGSDSHVISQQSGPSGTTLTIRQDLARSSSDLVPLMATLQVGGGSTSGVSPYVGMGGGLEVLHLSAENFQTGERFDGTFAGLGWQLWGGVALPLSGPSRVNAEVFYNGGELSRDVDDPTTGLTLRETVDVNGAGARLGFCWAF
jgi:opacity protein-like surface antigen